MGGNQHWVRGVISEALAVGVMPRAVVGDLLLLLKWSILPPEPQHVL